MYQLGSATIQLEKNLIYVAPKGEGDWKARARDVCPNACQAASMDELLKLARVKAKK